VEQAIALLTLPAHPSPRLSPGPSEFLQLFLHLRLAVRLSIARVAIRPFAELGWLARAFRTSDMLAGIADIGRCGNEQILTHMTVTSDALSRRLIYQLVAATSPDGEHSLSLGLLHTLFLGLLLFRRLLLGETRALLAPFVLALQAHLVGAVKGSAAVAAAMDTHTDRFLDTLDGGFWSWCSDPLV